MRQMVLAAKTPDERTEAKQLRRSWVIETSKAMWHQSSLRALGFVVSEFCC